MDPDDLSLIPSLLHETLPTISSPAFSEFVLKLEGYPVGARFFHLLSSKTVWGGGWRVIDRDLNDMVHAIRRGVRLVIRVGAGGGVWTPELRGFVGRVFPLMNARGLVKVEVVKPTFQLVEGERFIL